MARRSRRSQRFRKATSDRSGFDLKNIELIKDGAYMVSPDEFDVPPPSKKPLGGEGEVTGSARDSDSTIENTATPAGHDNPIVYVTAARGITPGTHPYMHTRS